MSEPVPRIRNDSLSPEEWKQIEDICDSFEQAWNREPPPPLEEYLVKDWPQPQRAELLRDLLIVELDRRRARRERPDAEEYHQRFAHDRVAVDQAFAATIDGDPHATEYHESNKGTSSSRQIGPYKLLQQIGEGGMGAVWMAEQQRPVRRRVALKLIKAGHDSREIIARFEAERQALAMMDHQNIAKVLDAGVTEDGRPFFAMELVQGIPLTDYCDKNKLTPRERLGLFIPVCRAIQHAHQKGIIHRDIKPSNVLVTLYDGQPVPKVIDFGLAKALQHSQQLTDKTMFTEYGKVVGTLNYMSPEQSEMNALDVDTRSDIYSLGVMLYELLTGSTPLEEKSARNRALLEVLAAIRDEEPPRPSTRLSQSGDAATGISAQRRTDPKKLQQMLRGDLDWIAMKALEKDRTRRYETAAAFADDVQRFLDDEPIEARPPSASYRARKLLRRHWKPILAAAALVLVMIFGVIGTTIGMLRARKATDQALAAAEEAQTAEARATKVKDYLVQLFRSPDPEKEGREVTVLEVMDEATEQVRNELSSDPAIQAEILDAITETYISIGMHNQARRVNAKVMQLHEAGASDERAQMRSELLQAVLLEEVKTKREKLEGLFHRASDQFGDADDISIEAAAVLAWLNPSAGTSDPRLSRVLAAAEAVGKDNAAVRQARFVLRLRGVGREDVSIEELDDLIDEATRKFGKDSLYADLMILLRGAKYFELLFLGTDSTKEQTTSAWREFDDAVGRLERMYGKESPAFAPFWLVRTRMAFDLGKVSNDQLDATAKKFLAVVGALDDDGQMQQSITRDFLIRGNVEEWSEFVELIRSWVDLGAEPRWPDQGNASHEMQMLVAATIRAGRLQEAGRTIADHPGLAEAGLLHHVLRDVDTASAILIYKEALDRYQRSFGDQHVRTATVLWFLARSYYDAKKHEQALATYRQLLENLPDEQIGSDEHHDLLSQIAMSHRMLGNRNEEIKLRKEALRLRLEHFPDDTQKVWWAYSDLSRAYANAGQLAEAIEWRTKAVDYVANKLGEDHPQTWEARYWLTDVLGEAWQTDQSIELLQRVHAWRSNAEQTEGFRFSTTQVLQSLAERQFLSRQYEDALQTRKKMLAEQQEEHGENHAKTISAIRDVAKCYLQSGLPELAVDYLERAMALADQAAEREEAAKGPLLRTMSMAHSVAGDHDKAVTLTRRALELARRDHAGDTVELWDIEAYTVAKVLLAAGRNDEAIEIRRRILEQTQRKFGSEHELTLKRKAMLAWALLSDGRVADAAAMFAEAAEQQTRLLGEMHAHTLYSLRGQAFATLRMGKHVDALEQIIALARRHRQTEYDDPLAEAEAFALLAEAALANGKYKLAAQSAARATELMEVHCPPLERHQLFNAQRMLGEAKHHLGEASAARELLQDSFVGLSAFPFPVDSAYRYRVDAARQALDKSYEVVE